jgi:hypothetical protein
MWVDLQSTNHQLIRSEVAESIIKLKAKGLFCRERLTEPGLCQQLPPAEASGN